MLHAVEVLIATGCLRAALAARAWEDASYGGRLTDGAELQLEETSRDETCHVRFGDTFHAVSQILVPLDFIWLALAVLLALAVILWMPYFGLHINESTGVRKLEATKWYRAGFASLTSHAAGIVGFVGFQKIVVARIVSVSDICNMWSLDNLLLYTTLALSIVAMSASFVFLGVDYTRRLVIDAAKQQGYRLMLKPKMLEHTGFGKAILSLAALMLLLYSLVIYEEIAKNTIFQKWLLLDTVCGSGTVVLFYINLRGLYRSPKVQFDTTSHSFNEDMTLEEFLEKHSNSNSQRQTSWATFLEWAAGEDLALLATRGSRHALFPNQRFTPLLHAVCGLLLLGAFPIMVQFAAQSLFTDPELQELKALTGSLVKLSPEEDESTGAFDFWEFLKMKKSEKPQQRFVFLTSEAASLQVTPVYRYTSSVEFCCSLVQDYDYDSDCNKQRLNHSVIKFFGEPLVIALPSNFSNVSANCNLTLHGLSSHSETRVAVRVEPKKVHGLCDCSMVGCGCCPGFGGNLTFLNLKSPDSNSLHLLSSACSALSCKSINNTNGKKGTECACNDGYVGNLSYSGGRIAGSCIAVPCNLPNSNQNPGLACKCNDGFRGNITWNGPNARGRCEPAPCNIENSNKQPGLSCKCADGFHGDIAWKGDIPADSCKPAACSIVDSTREPGLKCKCADEFLGKITWGGPNATGPCVPAPCNIEKSNNQPGPSCKCADGFDGDIVWNSGTPTGSCAPAECGISNTTGKGLDCKCAYKFVGGITWEGAVPHGRCVPAPCKFQNSNEKPGPACACAYGYKETRQVVQTHLGLFHLGDLFGVCAPIPCEGERSNHQDGPGCRCGDAYNGTVQLGTKRRALGKFSRYLSRTAAVASVVFKADSCVPAKCAVENTIGDGKECDCKDGYQGSVTWIGPNAVGTCKPAHCSIENSNGKPGLECKCLDGYGGSISWTREVASGTCTILPCRIPHSDFAEGPFCRCLQGFYGAIKRRGDKLEGECLPTPKCSQNIVHAASLARSVKDFDDDGNVCDAGEPLVLHGHECGHQRIQWTSALSAESSRCKRGWHSTTCGRPPHDTDLIFTRPLPLECSNKAAEPRCDSKIVYTVTNQEAAEYNCPAPGNESSAEKGTTLGTKPRTIQKGSVLQFTGRLCGYDLIVWEFVDILSESLPPCQVNLSLSCGEIPHGEHLPRSCKNVGMPATFIASREGADENQEDGEDEEDSQKTLVKNLVKFFQNGEYSIEGLENDTSSSSKTHTWWSAGWTGLDYHLFYSLPDLDSAELEKAPEAPDGSKFVEPDTGLHLATVGVVPVWWAFKFQEDEVLRGYAGVFDTDSLDDCFLHYFRNGTCYQIVVGRVAQISHKTESECPIFRGMDGENYIYDRSLYGTQIYRSHNSCSSSLTASREFEFEIADVRSQNAASLTSASSIVVGGCRTALRLALDTPNIQCDGIY